MRRKWNIKILIMGIVVLFLVPSAYAAAVLITNGDFETGDLTGWASAGQAGVQSKIVFDGSYAAYIGTVDFDGNNINDITGETGDYVYNNYISQDIYVPTDVISPTLKLIYNVYTNDAGSYDDPAFVVKIDNTNVLSLSANSISGYTGWTGFSYDLTGYEGKTLTLSIYAGNTDSSGGSGDTSYQSWAYVDDVNVDYTPAPVPLPPSAYMFFPVLGGLIFWRRKREI